MTVKPTRRQPSLSTFHSVNTHFTLIPSILPQEPIFPLCFSLYISSSDDGHVSNSRRIPFPSHLPPGDTSNQPPPPPLQQDPPRSVDRSGGRSGVFVADRFAGGSRCRGRCPRRQEARGRHPQHDCPPHRTRLAPVPPRLLLLGPTPRLRPALPPSRRQHG